MFDTSYDYLLKGKRKGELDKTVHLFTFRTTRNRQIIVEMHEHAAHPVVIVKFFDKAHRLSLNRFSLMSSSSEAPRIIRTAIQVMLDFHQQNPFLSFAFMGAPDANGNLDNNKRFRVYKGVMQRLFSDLEFEHLQNPKRSLYILLNRNYCYRQPEAPGEIFKLLKTAYPDEWDTNA